MNGVAMDSFNYANLCKSPKNLEYSCKKQLFLNFSEKKLCKSRKKLHVTTPLYNSKNLSFSVEFFKKKINFERFVMSSS